MTTLVILIVLALLGWVVWKLAQNPDKNNDGKVDAKDVLAAAKEVAEEVKAEAVEAAAVVKAEAAEVVKKVKKGRKKKAD